MRNSIRAILAALLLAFLTASCGLNDCGEFGPDLDAITIYGQLRGAETLTCYPHNCELTIQALPSNVQGSPLTFNWDPTHYAAGFQGPFQQGDRFSFGDEVDVNLVAPFAGGAQLTLTVVDAHTGETLVTVPPDSLDPTQYRYRGTSEYSGSACYHHDLSLGSVENPVVFTVPTTK